MPEDVAVSRFEKMLLRFFAVPRGKKKRLVPSFHAAQDDDDVPYVHWAYVCDSRKCTFPRWSVRLCNLPCNRVNSLSHFLVCNGLPAITRIARVRRMDERTRGFTSSDAI